MSDTPKAPRGERFTMLEPRGPNTKLPGSETWPVVKLQINERFTMLEARGPNNPSPQEPTTPVTEARIEGPPELPPAVVSLVAELASVVARLDARGRSAALDYISAELPRRTAG